MESALPSLPRIVRAPKLSGLGPWHNTAPLTAENLQGQVVLIDFWTYSCINCLRTLPYLKEWWEKYRHFPFLLLGVHTPEFTFEKDENNVAAAISKLGVAYPVAQDNKFETWNEFANLYWPAKYLIDGKGYIRYTHFGEGGYRATEAAIQSLLLEVGASAMSIPLTEDEKHTHLAQTPETYFNSRSWNAFGNGASLPKGGEITYVPPPPLDLHAYYLVGKWELKDDEREVLRSEKGEIRIRFLGLEANIVLGLEEGSHPGEVDIEVDGGYLSSFNIDRSDMYPLFKGEYGDHELTVRLRGKGIAAYAFTFGGS